MSLPAYGQDTHSEQCIHVYVVVQFYPWFKFWGVETYDHRFQFSA